MSDKKADRVRERCAARRAAMALALVWSCIAGAAARGSDTQWWISSSPADYAGAESRGVVVRPDGALELGPAASVTSADSLDIVWALAVLEDGSVALGGENGRIDRWTASGGIRPWVRLPVGQVLSLAADGDGLVAGTAPAGLIYRVGARGDTALLARTGERYVWGLAPAGRGAWYAATGTRGRLLRIERGAARVLLDTEESNLVSLLSDGRGGVYAGGDSRGTVVQVRADGTARTLFDASEEEVRSLAVGADGALYAAGLSASAVSPRPAERAAAKTGAGDPDAESDGDEESPEPVRSPVSGGRARVYRIVPDSSAVAWWSSPQPFVFALAPGAGGIVVATGNRAAVFLLEDANRATQWLAAPGGQITALAVGGDGTVYAAGSNPGSLWRLGPGRAARGELEAPVSDARRIARFGRVRWEGRAGGARVELRTRSGNTEEPDTTWSAWEGGPASAEGLRIASPPARYLQWKVTLAGGDPRIAAVEAAWRENNLPPRVDNVVIAPQGQGFSEGGLLPRAEPVTQNLPSGQKVEYSLKSPSTPQELRALPMWARGLRTVQWTGSDPNGDPLLYALAIRDEDNGQWITLEKDLDATAYTWDTRALPNGRYRLRVIGSDAGGNAVGEERSAEALSDPFTVDNTSPEVVALDAQGAAAAVRVRGRAEDALSPLSRIEVSLDDGDWRAVTPVGGLTDARTASFELTLPAVAAGAHTVSVRAVDLAGNSATRATRVTVPAAR
ncbi:MAG: hypothetical protein A2W00_06380 [Candidatus Eisenbacteria bacterium RBG_16_71_46]|nr:MAG: hypothetical protein A2W00_06380 [Candidatus Eisenbacteria bacterium RBG_16_71_46]